MISFFLRALYTLFALAVCAWPLWAYLGVRSFAAPDGFWQELVLAGIGIWALGSLQIVFLAIAMVWIFFIWEL